MNYFKQKVLTTDGNYVPRYYVDALKVTIIGMIISLLGVLVDIIKYN